MRILLHICCGPCAVMPIRALIDEGYEVFGFFYNPNIHPLAEYMRRREGAIQATEQWADPAASDMLLPHGSAEAIPLAFPLRTEEYNVLAWIQATFTSALESPAARCQSCWGGRLDRTALYAREHGFDTFTTSLLYSRYQKHEGIACAGEQAAAKHAVHFLYRDFRPLWQQGVDASKGLGIYRQPYCGCVFSEEERYARAFARL